MPRNIRLSFNHVNTSMMKVIATMIRNLESVQRIATKIMPPIQKVACEERLKEVNLISLEERR